MGYFYGKEEENFALKQLLPLKDVPFGTFRLAGGGKAYSFLSENGLLWGQIP